MTILSLAKAREKEVDPSLIQLAEDLLSKVKSGEIVSLVGVGECLDGAVAFFRGGEHNPYSTMGALEALKNNIYIDSFDDEE